MDGFAGALPRQPPAPMTLRMGQIAAALRRHVWLIAALALLAAAGAYAYARTLPKVYTASTTFTVEGERFAIPELQGALRNENAPDPMPWVRTEVQALTARALVSKVAADLRLDRLPEFNPALRPPTLAMQARERVTALMLPFLPQGPADSPAPGPDEDVTGAVSRALSVFQDNRSLVIAVAFTSEDPRLAASFVNTLVGDYVAARAKRRVDANQGANQAMLDRIEQVRADLSGIEQQMRDLRNKAELVSVRAGGVGQQQLEELTTAAARATLERSQLEVSFERAAAAAKQGSSDLLSTVLSSATISRLRDQETAASGRAAQLSTRYGPDFPGVRSAGAELASIRRQIAEEATRIVGSLGAQLRVARAQETDVQSQLQVARRAAVGAENSRAQLDQLQQEATTRRNLYQTLMERAQQTVAQPKGAETPDVRVLSPAVPPGLPSGPNSRLGSLMGGLGGGLLGCLIALARIRGVDRVVTGADVADATGLPLLGTLPAGMVRPGRGLLAATPELDGPDARELRAMRDRLRLGGRGMVARVALFVPVQAGDAASELAAALARVAAADGERVLLVEGDLQSPRLARVLMMNGRRLQAAAADWRDAVVMDRQSGLDLLLAEGRAVGARTATGAHFQNLIVEARREYDLVVLDSPAAAAGDALAFAQRADVTVLVSAGRVGTPVLQAAAARLQTASRTPVMTVLSGAR